MPLKAESANTNIMTLPELPKLDCTSHVCAAMDIVTVSSQFLRPLAKQEPVSMKHTKRGNQDKSLP